MHFGQVDPEEKLKIDYTLPGDDELTLETLSSTGVANKIDIRIGCTKWGSKHWVGQIYPPMMKESEFLSEYVRHFNAIELNASYYRSPDIETMQRWIDKVKLSPEFKFCPKFPQNISHIRRLANAEEPTTSFYKSLAILGEHGGPAFLQLPENFRPKQFENLKKYLRELPTDYPVFVEIRHQDWYADQQVRVEYFALLKELNIGAVISDAPGRRDCLHMTLPTPHAFIRFVGNGDQTDERRLIDWADRIIKWKEMGLQSVWFFMHQQADIVAPVAIDYFVTLLNDRLDMALKRPQFTLQ